MQHKSEPQPKRSRGKVATGIVAVGLAAALLVGGTFAWTDFKQHKDNPISGKSDAAVTLNDEFIPDKAFEASDTASKKVSVTNPADGDNSVFVRLKLKEFMQTFDVAYEPILDPVSNEKVYFATWANGPKIGEYLTAAEAKGQGFQYEVFTVDNVEYARIAPDLTTNPENRNGIYGKVMYDRDKRDAQTVKEIFGTAERATIDTHEQPDTKDADEHYACDYEAYKWDGRGIEKRPADSGLFSHDYFEWEQGGQVASMAAWIAEDKPLGDFWVYDTDGWCYWANALQPGKTTSNILESIKLLTKPSGDYEYIIHVDMQATDATDLEMLETDATENGKDLIDKLKPAYITPWVDNGDGTATRRIVKDNQFQEEHTIIGLDGIPGTEDDNKIVNPAGNSLLDAVQVTNANNTPYVDLGNEFRLYGGEDGKIGTIDDVVKGFGEYAQSDVTGATKDPIDWLLLDIQGDRALIVANTVLDALQFNLTTEQGNDWATSNLRNWLNSTGGQNTSGDTTGFYNTAFSDDEKTKILETDVSMAAESFPALCLVDPLNPSLGYTFRNPLTIGAKTDTTDRVFALSGSDIFTYFGKNIPANDLGLDEALYRNAYVVGNAYSREKGTVHMAFEPWTGNADSWLRSGGQEDTPPRGSRLATNGSIHSNSLVTSSNLGARPAVTVSLS